MSTDHVDATKLNPAELPIDNGEPAPYPIASPLLKRPPKLKIFVVLVVAVVTISWSIVLGKLLISLTWSFL
jgi:hypothetical protein